MANIRYSQLQSVPEIEYLFLPFLIINNIFHNGSTMQPFEWELFMPSITIKKIPDRLFRTLRQSARANNRSINKEVISNLEKSLGETLINPVAFLSSVDQMRKRLRTQKLTERILRKAKELGRS
jgi:hypothetical protein